MWRLLLKITFIFSLIALLAQCGVSDKRPGEQAQIPASDTTVTFLGSEWSNVVFKHLEHADRYHGECIKCHDHEPIAGQTHWYCRTCHTAGQDREQLCNAVQYHGCTMTQCHNCHEVKGQNPGLGCMDCHKGGQLSGVDSQAPTIPIGLTATAVSPSQTDLSWTASTDNMGVAGYRIYRGGVYLKPATGTSTSDTGLAASTPYCYRVSAYDAANNESAQSTEVCATTQADTETPTVPTGLTATAPSSSQTDLSWTASTDNVGVVGYNLYRGGVYLKSVTGTSTSDTGLPSNTLYCYQVTAYDAAAYESNKSTPACPSSPVASGTTPGGTPSLILEDSVDQPSEIDHWTLTVSTSGTIVIDVEAWESCNGSGKINIPNDFFGDGQKNNKLHANMYLFNSDGTVRASSTGRYSADTCNPAQATGRCPIGTPAPPGNHNTRSGQNPYINVSVPGGTYKLAIGSWPISNPTDAWNGVNNDGSEWMNSYNGSPTYNKYRIKIYFN